MNTIGDVMRELRSAAYAESCALRAHLDPGPPPTPPPAEYRFAVSCPVCAAELDHQADGRPTATRSCALALCTACRRQWQITVVMETVFSGPVERTPPGLVQCGTDSGYRRHLRNGERACDRCRTAHAAANASRKVCAS